MSHRVAGVKVRLQGHCLKLAFDWLLAGISWQGVSFRRDCSWTPRLLTLATLLWAWSDEGTLVERFGVTRRLVTQLFGQEPASSYQAFMKLLGRWSGSLLALLKVALRERLRQSLGDGWLVAGYCVFGVDGSRVELPRTCSHQAAFAAARRRTRRQGRRVAPHRQAETPQLWLTTLWHVGAGLPWDWRRGPADSSERDHWLEMLSDTPEGALMLADAGFVGYRCWSAVLGSGRRLLIRVGSNVRLLRQLGYARQQADTVYLWPDDAARRRQPPLVLRLIEVHDGKQPVTLVTDLRVDELKARQLAELYQRRWGVELFYRSFKQTFGRRKLRCAAAANAPLELDWSLAGLWTMSLYTLVQLQQAGQPLQRLSCAKLLRCVRRSLRDYLHVCHDQDRLTRRLQHALIDPYQRGNRSSRNYPRQKREHPPGRPRIQLATPTQINAARLLKRLLAA